MESNITIVDAAVLEAELTKLAKAIKGQTLRGQKRDYGRFLPACDVREAQASLQRLRRIARASRRRS